MRAESPPSLSRVPNATATRPRRGPVAPDGPRTLGSRTQTADSRPPTSRDAISYDAPPPPQSPYGGSPYGGTPAAPSSNKGTWALVCGILGLVCCGLLGIPAIILGRQAQAEGHRGGTAKAGEVLGYIALALMVLGGILFAAGVLSVGGSGN